MGEEGLYRVDEKGVDSAMMKAFPAGIVLPWLAQYTTLPEGWAVCDGESYPGSDGKLYRAPDLRGTFLRGVTKIEEQTPLGTPAAALHGSNSQTLNLQHQHGGSTGSGPTNGLRIKYDNGDDSNGVWYDHAHSIGQDLLNNYVIDTVPKHWNIVFIIRLP